MDSQSTSTRETTVVSSIVTRKYACDVGRNLSASWTYTLDSLEEQSAGDAQWGVGTVPIEVPNSRYLCTHSVSRDNYSFWSDFPFSRLHSTLLEKAEVDKREVHAIKKKKKKKKKFSWHWHFVRSYCVLNIIYCTCMVLGQVRTMWRWRLHSVTSIKNARVERGFTRVFLTLCKLQRHNYRVPALINTTFYPTPPTFLLSLLNPPHNVQPRPCFCKEEVLEMDVVLGPGK